jgi:hypothetical protein
MSKAQDKPEKDQFVNCPLYTLCIREIAGIMDLKLLCLAATYRNEPEGMYYRTKQLARLLRTTETYISRRITFLEHEKGLIKTQGKRSWQRHIYLTEKTLKMLETPDPPLIDIPDRNVHPRTFPAERNVTPRTFLKQRNVHSAQAECHPSDITPKDNESNILIQGADAPGECESFSAAISHGSPSPKKHRRETATDYTTTPAFDAFWELVRFSKGDKFPAWQQWRRLNIEGKGLTGRVTAALEKAVPEWQRREPQYRPRVAKWLADGNWMDNGQDDEPMMTDEEFRSRFPNEEALQRYEQIQRERYGL